MLQLASNYYRPLTQQMKLTYHRNAIQIAIGTHHELRIGMARMKLVWFEIMNYKRFAGHSKVNLGEKLVAIVGPNEAGKTSILKCLLHLHHREAFAATGGSQEISRGVDVSEDATVAEWTFAIENSDRDALKGIPEAANVRWFSLTKKKNGKAYFHLTPWPVRSLKLRRAVQETLEVEIPKSMAFGESSLVPSLQDLAELLKTSDESLPNETLEKLSQSVTMVANTQFDALASHLSELHSYETLKPPTDRIGAILTSRMPAILSFDELDRNLKSEYDLDQYFRAVGAKEIPVALNNLANAADLDLKGLHSAQATDDRGRVRTILQRAEDKLTSLVVHSWTQSQLSIGLELDGFRLQVLVRSVAGEFVKVLERSDGLRQFVALLFFLARQPKSDCKPILLIDEAESRLHYDAQADLVQVLAKQQLASKVIYTTHSIGCLPEDLGSGIRMVVTDDPYSTIENYFWNSNRPGFSPLLFSMGAQTLAFLPIRYALIAEGAADMILLPAILKSAFECDELGFQVVPGLASGNSDEIAILNNESVRTAYLVDGDDAGHRMKSKIKAAGVADAMIISLPIVEGEETVIEDYLSADVYLSAVQVELTRSGCSKAISIEDIPRPNRPKCLEKWCKSNGVSVPSKRAVAYHVVEKRFEETIFDASLLAQIETLHNSVRIAIGLVTH